MRVELMDSAINISTNKLISAFEIHKNGSYQNLIKGEWIMPQDSVSNYEELNDEDKYTHYVKEKEYRNKFGTYVWVSPHFSKYPGSKADTIPESKEHRQIKNWLFTKIKNDDLLIVYSKGSKKYKFDNFVKLSELDINWNNYNIEVSTKGYKTLRADILLQFNKKHMFLGNGIFIEIQLSKQSKKETYERSFSRAIHGYSTAWLFEDDFLFDEESGDFQLKEEKINLFSFSSELKYSGKSFVKNLKIVVEEQCRYIDDKIKESNYNATNITNNIDKAIIDINRQLLQAKEESLQEMEDSKDELANKIRNLENNPLEEIMEIYDKYLESKKDKIIEEVDKVLVKMREVQQECIDHILEIASDKKKSIEETYPKVIDCNKCGGIMVFKITPNKKKELYDCQNCENVSWVK